MLRQPLVEERVVAVEQLQQAPILPDDVLEEHLGLLPHGPPQVAGQLELAEPAERPKDGRALLAALFLLGVGELSGGLRFSSRNRRAPIRRRDRAARRERSRRTR